MEFVVSSRQAGWTVGVLLKRELGISTTLLNQIKRRPGALLRNGLPVFTNAVTIAGDRITVDLSDPPAQIPTVPIPMDLDIIYEDEFMLVVNKNAPLAVHASSFSPEEPTLANGLAAHLGPSFTLHPVNRLDRGTTGLMTVAKNQYIHNLLRQQFHTEDFYREYRGVALGIVSPAAGEICLPIGRCADSPIKRCVRAEGAASWTGYETLRQANGLTLLRLIPHTGRTHQLRLHMAAIGFPLAGDWLYGTEDKALIPRPALHAALLRLRHPVTGALLDLEAPLPADMDALLAPPRR